MINYFSLRYILYDIFILKFLFTLNLKKFVIYESI